MQVPDLDIIAGLEEAYFKVVQFVSASAANAVQLRRSRPAKSRRYLVGLRGLPVLWHDLYNGLSGARHLAWTGYWESLPFGSHGGANGYPGSGFSAFIYANAPLYKAGLDLILDPPSYFLVDQECLSYDFTYAFGNVHGYSLPSQSFQPSFDSTLGRITLKLRKFGSPTDNLVCTIRADSSGLPGSVLYTADAVISGSSLHTFLVDFDFDFLGSSPALTHDTPYWIQLDRSGSVDNTNYFGIAYQSTGDVYSRGIVAIYNYFIGWQTDSGADLYFKEYTIT